MTHCQIGPGDIMKKITPKMKTDPPSTRSPTDPRADDPMSRAKFLPQFSTSVTYPWKSSVERLSGGPDAHFCNSLIDC